MLWVIGWTLALRAVNKPCIAFMPAICSRASPSRWYLLATLALLLAASAIACFPASPSEERPPWPIPDLSVETQATSGTSVAIQITNPGGRPGAWYGHCRYRKTGNPIARLSDVHITADPIAPMQSQQLTITGLTEGDLYRFVCYLDTQKGRIQGASTSMSVTATP